MVRLNPDFVQKSGFLKFLESLCRGLHTPGREENVVGHCGKAEPDFVGIIVSEDPLLPFIFF